MRNAERRRELLDSVAGSAYSAVMALRDLWRKLTRRRAEDKELDTRPGLNKLPATGHFVQPPPPPPGQDKPKY